MRATIPITVFTDPAESDALERYREKEKEKERERNRERERERERD